VKSVLETWKPVVGYEGLYQVSDFGEVISLNYKHTGQSRVLKPMKDRKGYLNVNLYKNGKKKRQLVHRLVAQAFIDNPDNLPEVNHIDENKENNKVCSGMVNLEWCNRKYNVNHGTGHQRSAETQRGVYNTKKSEIVLQMNLDYILIKEWPSTRECDRNGFSQSVVSRCCNNKYCKQGNVYKGYRWIKKEEYYKMFAA